MFLSDEIPPKTAAEVMDRIDRGRTLGQRVDCWRGKTLKAAEVLLALDDYFEKNLRNKKTCENDAEIFLSHLAGHAAAWLRTT